MVEQSLRRKVVSRGFVSLIGAVLVLATKGLIMKTWSVRGVAAVLAVVVLANGVRAEELGFPESCIELASVPRRTLYCDGYLRSHTMSTRDSVLFSFDYPNRKQNPGEVSPFIAWDTQTGKWLARMPAPNPDAMGWKFSPDGTLLAVPICDNTRVIQLWEVGSKDAHGVPTLRLLTKLHQRYRRPTLPDPRKEGHASFGDTVLLVWTPDSKTLLASLAVPKHEIQFWSRTDKPSVWDESDRETKWKPWAKLEVDTVWAPGFAVSPDNKSLAVISNPGKGPSEGQIVDLATAKLQENFQVKQRANEPDVLTTGDRLRFSPDSKTLAINGDRYLALWDTAPLAQRVEMVNPDFLCNYGDADSRMAFIQDSRWLLTVKVATHEDRLRLTGGLIQLQIRDAQSGELRKEVGFPEELGQLETIETMPDGRLMTRFAFRKKNKDLATRCFLWHDEDLLRYAAEHGSAPPPKQKAN